MLYHAIGMRDSLHQRQRKEAEKLTVKKRELTTEQVEQQTKLWLRIAKQRGVNVQALVDPEYKPSIMMDKNQRRIAAFKQLDSTFSSRQASAVRGGQLASVDAAEAADQHNNMDMINDQDNFGQQQQLE